MNYIYISRNKSLLMNIKDKLHLIKFKLTRTIREIIQILFTKSEISNPQVRYVEGNDILLGKMVKYPDYLSYQSIKKEIFNKNIYKLGKIKNAVIIDCGANIGLSTIYFKHENPDSEVIAIEADQKILQYLKYNTNQFNTNNLKIINAAVWDEETILEFNSEGADGGRIHSFDFKEFTPSKTKVRTILLSKLINRKIDLLKIDIEGAETRVIHEIKDKLHLVDRIFIEYHSFKYSTQTLNEILSILRENNFRFYIKNGADVSMQPFEKINLIFGIDNMLNIFAYKANLL